MKHTKHILALALALALVFFASTPSYAVVPNHLYSDIIAQFCDVYGVSIKHYTDAQGPKQPNFIWAHSTPWVDTKPRPDNILDTEEWEKIEKLFQKYANEFDETYHIQLLDGSHRNIILADDITIVPNDEDLSDYTISSEPERNSETGELLRPEATFTPTPTPQPAPTPQPPAAQPTITVDNKAMSVKHDTVTVTINGQPVELEAVVLTEPNGGAHTYFKLRDVGQSVGFDVDWSAETGITVDSANN